MTFQFFVVSISQLLRSLLSQIPAVVLVEQAFEEYGKQAAINSVKAVEQNIFGKLVHYVFSGQIAKEKRKLNDQDDRRVCKCNFGIVNW